MAAPTPTEKLTQIGHDFVLTWDGHWAGTGEFTNTAIVDVSADFSEYNDNSNVIVEELHLAATAGIEVELEFDATTDEPLAVSPEGVASTIDRDFKDYPNGGMTAHGSGKTGDILLTTTGAASGDRVFIQIKGTVW